MSDWTVESEQDDPIDVTMSDGRTIRLNRGDKFSTPLPCEMLDFLQRRDPDIPLRERTGGWYDALLAAGRADGCVGANDEINVTPTPGVSTTPAPAPPPTGGDSATEQGAPTVPSGVRLTEAGSDGTGTIRPPDQRGARRPEDEPRDHPDGQPDYDHGGAEPGQRVLGGDPVELFTGAFVINETDLDVETAALPLEFARTYRSGRAYYGPFGWGWDHEHNSYLRELADGSVAHWTGRLHEDRFMPGAGGFEPPFGVFETLERMPGPATRYVITAAEGHQREYAQPVGWPRADRIPLVERRDRHGNRLRYTYNGSGQLVEVRDDDDRFLRFHYGQCALLERVEDHAGRTVIYEHDPDIEHLISVRDGDLKVRRTYRYDAPWLAEEFRHGIIEVADDAGNTIIANTYEQDPSSWAFGRVIAQRHGDYLYQFRYTQLQRTPIAPLFLNVPSVQVEVMDPEFAVATSTFNSRGDLLDHRVRLVRDGSFRIVVYQFEYDSQGNRRMVRYPDGMEEHRTFLDADTDPRMRGRMVRREVRARTGFPAPSRILWRGTFEPTFQLPRTVSDEAGNTTTYRYDLDSGNPGATGRLETIKHPDATLPDGTVQHSTLAFESNARGQITAIVTAEGMRTEWRYGTVGVDRGLLTEVHRDVGGLDLRERYTHDAAGDIVAIEDASGAVRERAFDVRRRLVRLASPPLLGARAVVTLTRDGDGNVLVLARPRGAYDDAMLGGAPIRDELTYDALGNVTSSTLAANTVMPRKVRLTVNFRGEAVSATDASGLVVQQTFDERGMLIAKEARGPDGTRLREKHIYDIVGRRTHHWTGPLADVPVHYDYDAFGRLQRVRSANGSVVTYKWGADDLLEEMTVDGDPGDGTIRLLSRTRYTYDSRGRMVRTSRASFSDVPAAAVELASEYTYDGDNNCTSMKDARGAVTTYRHDRIGRLIETIDPGGNRVVRSYEGLDLVARVEHHHVDPGGTIVRVWTHTYDSRGREVSVTDPLGNVTTTEYDDRDVSVAVIAPDGVIERRHVGPCGEGLEVIRDVAGLGVRHAWVYDETARLLQYVDPTGQITQFSYDGVGRRIAVSRPGFASSRTFGTDGRIAGERLASGAEVRFSYDTAGRLATVEGLGASSVAPVPLTQFAYDGLDRLISATQGGSTIMRAYDSFGRLVRESRDAVALEASYDDLAGTVDRRWPDGRVERITSDANGFPTQVERVAAGALGNDGPAVAALVPSGPARVAVTTLQATVVAAATYDTAGRPTRFKYDQPGGPIEAFDYRFDSVGRRRFEQATEQGEVRLWTFDTIDRVSEVAEGFTPPLAGLPPVDQAAADADITLAIAASAAATEGQQLTYDAGDERRTLTPLGAAATAYTYGPGHRIATAGAEAITHHPDGVRAQDARRQYDVDALGRVVRVADSGNATTRLTLAYDALGRLSGKVAGGVTTRFFYFGNDLLLETENGAASRQYSAHPLGGPPLAVHRPGQSLIPIADLSGSRTGYCDVAGALLETYAFESFGTPTIHAPGGAPRANSAIAMEPVFAGLRWLPEVQLYLSPARLYDPRLGLFLSPDPFGASDSCNPYAYARHNPADYVDPDGELAFLAVLGIMAIGALAAGGLNAARQGIAISEGAQRKFSWSELGLNMGLGAVLAPVAVVAPEIAIPFAAMGVASGATEISRGHYATGLFDIGTSVLAVHGAVRSPSFNASVPVRVTNAKLTIARTDLNQGELGLLIRRTFTRNADSRASLQRQIGDIRITRSILDDPTITVRSVDPATRTATERPLGFDPSELGWDGVRRDVEFYRTDGTTAGDLDISLPRFDVEIKLGERAQKTAGKVEARDTFLPERANHPYFLASEIPPDVMARWRLHPSAIPIDIRTAAAQSFDGHLQVTPEMRGGTPYFFRDLLTPTSIPLVIPSVGRGRK